MKNLSFMKVLLRVCVGQASIGAMPEDFKRARYETSQLPELPNFLLDQMTEIVNGSNKAGD
jgi:hypothetical protein